MKKSPIAIIFFFLLLLGGNGSLKSQDLNQLIRSLRENNPSLKALDLQYQSSTELGKQQGQLPDLELGAGAFILPIQTRTGAQRFRLGFMQSFPWMGTLKAKEDLANSKALPFLEKKAMQERALIYELKMAYLALYELREKQNILKEKSRVLESLRQLALIKVSSGKGSSADVLLTDINLQQLKKEIDAFEVQESIPTLKINSLLNRRFDFPISVNEDFALARIQVAKDTLQEHLQQYYPALREIKQQQEISMKTIQLNELESKPNLALGVDYLVIEERPIENLSQNGRDVIQLKAGVRIPLSKEKFRAKNREEELKIAAMEEYSTQLSIGFVTEMEQALATYKLAVIQIDALDDLKGTSQDALNLMENEYSVDKRPLEDILNLEAKIIEYDLERLKWIMESQKVLTLLEKYLGPF